MTEDADPELDALLEFLKRNRGFDFTAYKRSTLQRRIEKRMQSLNIARFPDYMDYLEVHPGEFAFLFSVILINVTEFFRDPAAWEYLGAEVIPRIIAHKSAQEPIRVWSAGCATGEEAYSVTMLLAEALGIEQLRDRVKVYATDVDEEALTVARQGAYPLASLEHVPPHLIEKYFEQDGSRCVFQREARRVMNFGRHDLIQDPPISGVDLLVSRNTLMYFNTDVQSKILSRFHFALSDGGYFMAGRAEMLLTHGDKFTPVDLKRRIFTKVVKEALNERMAMLLQANNIEVPERDPAAMTIFDAAFEAAATPHLILDAAGNLVSANDRARSLFRLGPRDRGRPLRELELPIWQAEVTRSLDHAFSKQVPATIEDVEWHTPGGDPRHYEISIKPLRNSSGGLLGASVIFEDISAYRDMQNQLQRSRQELETVSEELQSSNEELETTNEELQSTVEELETTNEELQSTNEELETMNEEMQSTNEELQTMNDELRQRSEDVTSANAFLESVMVSMQNGLAVIDRDARISAWNPAAEDLWGLRPNEVRGKSLFSLDIGLPTERLGEPIRACLAGQAPEITLEATNRRGKKFACRVTCSPLRSRDEVEGAILTMAEAPNQ